MSKSAPGTPRTPSSGPVANLDDAFAAAGDHGGQGQVNDAASIPDDFAGEVNAALEALMDGSPTSSEHHQGQVQVEPDHNQVEEAQLCCICHDALLQEGMECEALACGHVFHKECLTQCREVGGFVGAWCPFKCHDSTTGARQVPPVDADDNWEII